MYSDEKAKASERDPKSSSVNARYVLKLLP